MVKPLQSSDIHIEPTKAYAPKPNSYHHSRLSDPFLFITLKKDEKKERETMGFKEEDGGAVWVQMLKFWENQ